MGNKGAREDQRQTREGILVYAKERGGLAESSPASTAGLREGRAGLGKDEEGREEGQPITRVGSGPQLGGDPWDSRVEKSEGSFNGHRCWSRKFSMKRGLFHMIKITTWALLASSGLVFFSHFAACPSTPFGGCSKEKWQKKFLFFSHTLIRKEWKKVGPARAVWGGRGRAVGMRRSVWE